MKLVVVLVIVAGCSGSLKHVNRIGMSVAVGELACDWHQTRVTSSQGWPEGAYEYNPVLGKNPSPGQIDVYMASVMAASLLVYRWLPERVRPALWVPIAVMQADSIWYNHTTVPGLCGFTGGPVVDDRMPASARPSR